MVIFNNLDLRKLGQFASKHGWKPILSTNEYMLSYIKDENNSWKRINIYKSTKRNNFTIATCLDHPKKGKTQLFRKNLDLLDIEIF